MNKTETAVLSEVDTTSITTDNGGDSYTFDISGLSFTNAPKIVSKDTATITTSIVATGAGDDFEARTIVSHTADTIGGSLANTEFETTLSTTTPTITTAVLTWSKDRNNVENHRLSNSVIGHTLHQRSDTQDTESTCGTTPSITTDDITWHFGDDAEATHTASNTDGSITSETKAVSYFSAVSYLSDGTTNATVGHGMGIVPELYTVKNREQSFSWYTYSATLGANKFLTIDSTSAENINTATWNNTAPTSSVFSVGSNGSNATAIDEYTAYCFASVVGVCMVGAVTIASGVMSGDTDLGFPLGFGAFKITNTTGDWEIIGSETTDFLEANTSNTEATNGADRVTVAGNIISNNGLPDGDYTFVAIAKEIDNAPTLITDVFDTDTRVGRDFKIDADLADDLDEVTRISIPIEKVV